MVIAFGNDSSLAKSPAQVRVAQFPSAQPLDLARAGNRSLNQAAVREEIFDCRKTLNLTDLAEDGRPRFSPIPGRSGAESNPGKCFSGQSFKFFLKLGDLVIIVADHSQVVLEADPAHGMLLSRQESLFPGIAVGSGLLRRNTVMGELMGIDPGEQFGTVPDKEECVDAGGRAEGACRRDRRRRAG